MKPRASALSASSEARRSKKRLAVYINKHAQLLQEVGHRLPRKIVRVKAGRKVHQHPPASNAAGFSAVYPLPVSASQEN